MLEERKLLKTHMITLDNRNTGSITGVLDVYAFDEEAISLMTEGGKLLLKGEHLHVRNLNLEHGEIEIEGKINSFAYLTKKAKKKSDSFLKQFFR